MSEPIDCDQECTGVAEVVGSMSADAVRKLVEEARSSLLCRVLEDVQAVVAAWREFSSLPTPLKDAT